MILLGIWLVGSQTRNIPSNSPLCLVRDCFTLGTNKLYDMTFQQLPTKLQLYILLAYRVTRLSFSIISLGFITKMENLSKTSSGILYLKFGSFVCSIGLSN